MIDNLAPWRPILSRALHRNRSQPNARYFQLATVDLNGKPANRTVVFRGFLENSNQLQIITDSRSEKINHIHYQPRSEICWYFPKTREQFRINGTLTIVDENHLNQAVRLTVWHQLSDVARQQFTWPPSGQDLTDNKEYFFKLTPPESQPISNFIILLFEPERVDHLELRDNPHQRKIYYLDDARNWIIQSVNP